MKKKIGISNTGYKSNSPDRFNMMNLIPSNRITMEGVRNPLLMIPMGSNGVGNPVMGMPGENYLFPNYDMVMEFPLPMNSRMNYQRFQNGGIETGIPEVTLPTVNIRDEAPFFAKRRDAYYQQYPESWYAKNKMPAFARNIGVGPTSKDWAESERDAYQRFIMDKVAQDLYKRNPQRKYGKDEQDRLNWYNSFTPKEREILANSSYASKFAPALRAYDKSQSNIGAQRSIAENFSDPQKLAQSVQGTAERFRLFPNAENNIEEYINPMMWIGNMAKNLGNAPKDVQEGNYAKAAWSVAEPIIAGGLGSIGAKSTGQWAKNILLPIDPENLYNQRQLFAPKNEEELASLIEETKLNWYNKLKSAEGRKRLANLINENTHYKPLVDNPVPNINEGSISLKRKIENYIDEASENLTPDDLIRRFGNMSSLNSRILHNRKLFDKKLSEFKNLPDDTEIGDLFDYQTELDELDNQIMIDKERMNAYKNNAFYQGPYMDGKEYNEVFVSPTLINNELDPYGAIHHEIGGHFFQQGIKTHLDDELSNLKLKDVDSKLKNLPVQNLSNDDAFNALQLVRDKNYFKQGSQGQEKLAFAAEIRGNMLNKGVIKDLYDPITPELLKRYYNDYTKSSNKNNKLRLFNLMENNNDNFKILSNVLNKMPALIPAAGVGAGYMYSQPSSPEQQTQYAEGGEKEKPIGDNIVFDEATGRFVNMDIVESMNRDKLARKQAVETFYRNIGETPKSFKTKYGTYQNWKDKNVPLNPRSRSMWMETGGEYAKGGIFKSVKKNKLPSNQTNKNIQSSINSLMKRNEMLFGPSGKKYYNPLYKKELGGMSSYTQPTENEFFNYGVSFTPPFLLFEYGGGNYPNPYYANGGTVSELWTEATGTPWSEAKRLGLTDGSYEANINLRNRIINGEFDNLSDSSTGAESQSSSTSRSTKTTTPKSSIPKPKAGTTKSPLFYKDQAEYEAHLLDPYSLEKKAAQLEFLTRSSRSKPSVKSAPVNQKRNSDTSIPIDQRRIPQSGVVVDKRTNQAYYFGDQGQRGSFPVLTGKNVDLNSSPYTVDELENHPERRSTPRGYYKMEIPTVDVPGYTELPMKGYKNWGEYLNKHYAGKIRDITPIPAYGMPAPIAEVLAFHRTYSDNANNPWDPEFLRRDALYSNPNPNVRCTSFGCVNVQDASYDEIYRTFPTSDTLMVLDSKNPLDAKLLEVAKERIAKTEVPNVNSSWFAYGGALPGGANEMPCFECGGYMQDGGTQFGGMVDNDMDYFKEGGNWIQKATKSIKRRGTEGVCTGDKFGGPSCPPGSKRYNLAKTFRAMAKKEFGGDASTVIDPNEDDYLSKYSSMFQNKLKQNTLNNIADEAAQNVNPYYGDNGMQVSAMNNYLRDAYADRIAQMEQNQNNAFSGMYNAMYNMEANADPYLKKLKITNYPTPGTIPTEKFSDPTYAYMSNQMPKAQIGIVRKGIDAAQNMIKQMNAKASAPSNNASIPINTGTSSTGNKTVSNTSNTNQSGNTNTGSMSFQDFLQQSYDIYNKLYGQNQGTQTNQSGTTTNNALSNIFPMNTNWRTRGNNFIPMVAYNPLNTYLQEYDYKGRLFGAGPRRLKMKFRTYFDPATGQVKQEPVAETNTTTANNASTSTAAVNPFASVVPLDNMVPSGYIDSLISKSNANTPTTKTNTASNKLISQDYKTPLSAQRNAAAILANSPMLQNQPDWIRNPSFTSTVTSTPNVVTPNEVVSQQENLPEETPQSWFQGYTPPTTVQPTVVNPAGEFADRSVPSVNAQNPFIYTSPNVNTPNVIPPDSPITRSLQPNVIPSNSPIPTQMPTGIPTRKIPLPVGWGNYNTAEMFMDRNIPSVNAPNPFAYGGYLPKAYDGNNPSTMGMLGRMNAKNVMDLPFDEEIITNTSSEFPVKRTPGYDKDGKKSVPYEDWEADAKYSRGYQNEDVANWLIAGLDTAASLANVDDYNRMKNQYNRMQLADNVFVGVPANRTNPRGEYVQTGMGTGMLNPQNMTPIYNPGMNYNFENPYMASYGGMYEEGGEYELSPDEINYIMANGGSITYID